MQSMAAALEVHMARTSLVMYVYVTGSCQCIDMGRPLADLRRTVLVGILVPGLAGMPRGSQQLRSVHSSHELRPVLCGSAERNCSFGGAIWQAP